MAASSAHQGYPQRFPATGITRAPAAQTQTPFAQPQTQQPPQSGYASRAHAPHANAAAAAADEKQRLERDGAVALSQLTDEQREEVEQAFQLFDMDRDRRIDYHELKVAMKALGFDVPKSEILAVLQTHGSPSTAGAQQQGQGQQGQQQPAAYHHPKLLLSFQSFQYLMAQRILARDPREEILRAFELFDEGGKGKISLQDLRRVARELGEGLQEEELVAMIEEFDLDGDGCIDQEEFLGICLG